LIHQGVQLGSQRDMFNGVGPESLAGVVRGLEADGPLDPTPPLFLPRAPAGSRPKARPGHRVPATAQGLNPGRGRRPRGQELGQRPVYMGALAGGS